MSREEMLARLEELQKERNRQYWIFTRTARGKPVSAALIREICELEEKLHDRRPNSSSS